MRLLLVLASVAAVGPFSTDLYLSTLPGLTADLRTSASGAQLTLTAVLVGMAVGQIIIGPLSDRVGRRGPLIAGAALCMLGAAASALAPTLGVLVAARVLQGVGGAAGSVLGRAIIADIAQGRAAARAFSLLSTITVIAPVIAPLLGSAIGSMGGWRADLATVWVITAVALVLVVLRVPETHAAARRSGRGTLRTVLPVLTQRSYVGNATSFVFGFAILMGYISWSPFLYQVEIGVPAGVYAVLFGLNALALVIVSAISARLTRRVPVRRILRVGLLGQAASVAVIAALVVTGAPAVTLAVPVFTVVASTGLVMGNAAAAAIEPARAIAGTASAVMGGVQFVAAAIAAPLVGVAGADSPVPATIVLGTASALAIVGHAAAGPVRPVAGVGGFPRASG